MRRHFSGLALATASVTYVLCRVAAAQTPPASRVLVVPFENTKREASIFWLGEASALLFDDALSALGVPVITREERREAFDRLQAPSAAALTDATVIRIGQLVGATDVVMGSFQLDNGALVVRARNIALETGRLTRDVTERGPTPEMFDTFERLARQIAPSGASSAGYGRGWPPLAVFENYVKGLLAETPSVAIRYLDTSLGLLPTFDRARLALWDVYAERDDHARALAAVLPVGADSPWSRRAKFLAGLSYLSLKKYDEAFTVFNALADAQPDAALLNNIGIVQLRRGATPQASQATYYFSQAAAADPNDADYFFNLGYAYWLDRDPQAASYWLREAVRRNPSDADAHFVLGIAFAASGGTAEAAREKELARRLSSRYEQQEKRSAGEGVPKGLERVKGGEAPPSSQQVRIVSSGQRDQYELAQFYLDRGRRLFQQGNDRDAIAELNRALYLSPYTADAHLLVGRIHLRNNRIHEAIDAFKIAIWSSETAEAHVALGEAYLQARDAETARAEAERAVVLDPTSSDAKRLIERTRAQ